MNPVAIIVGLGCVALALLLWRSRRYRINLAKSVQAGLQVQAELRERDAELDAMFNAVRIGTWSHNLFTNRAFSKGRINELYGFPAGQVEYKFADIVAAVHPDDRDFFVATAQAAMSGEHPQFEMEHRVVWPDGSTHWILAHGGVSQYRDGKPACLSGMNLDITGRKEIELRLRTSEAAIRGLNETLEQRIQLRATQLAEMERRLRLTISSLSDYALFMLDAEGRVTSWNQGAQRIKGYTAEEIVGKHFSIFYPPEVAQSGHPEEELRIAREEGRFQEEGWRVRKDGTLFWANVLVNAVRDDSGQLVGYFKVTRDRTERKRTVEMLETERARAEQANRAKSEFLAAMSHEIRTPMNAILGMAELLWETELDEDQRQYVQIFRHAGADLMALINDILDLSKIEAGRVELEQTPFDLEDVQDHVMELLGSKARDKGIVLLSRLAPGVTRSLVGDPSRLRQVLVNLVGNAVKFTRVGEVVLTAANVPGGTNGEIEFSVSDTGIGIPSEKIATIFDAFTQVDASTTRQFGGTGLGLAISKRLVERMGGVLTAESEMGKGSTFHFAVRFGVHPETARRLPAGVENLRGQRVLVMDDSATNRLILRESLTAWGLESREFSSAEEALEELETSVRLGRGYALVIADHHMQGMDGFEAAPRIREISPGTAVVMLTSDSQVGDLERRKEAGIGGFAVKPVKRSDLLRLVCEALKVSEPAPQGSTNHPAPPVAPAKRKRVLIADDSAENHFLIEAYLKDSPYALTRVHNGREAVEDFAASPCDLILMDLRMPVMDGLEATQAIRKLEKERGWKPVPVIALTANAQAGDIEKTRQAGCNAHLAKPVSKAALLRALSDYCGDPDKQPILVQPPEGLEELAPRYLSARRKELPELMALSDAANFDRLKTLAHNLKGTGSSYGFPDLTEIGAEMEKSAQAGDQGTIQEQLLRLSRYLDRVRVSGVEIKN